LTAAEPDGFPDLIRSGVARQASAEPFDAAALVKLWKERKAKP